MPHTKKTRNEYASATGSEQATNLTLAAKHSQNAFAHILFAYCVADYKTAATKSKALFIYDRFLAGLSQQGFGDVDMNKIDLGVDECGKDGVLAPIKSWIETLRRMQQQARATNRLVRIFTSSDRKPPPHLFDDFLEASLARTGDTVWKDIEGRMHLDVIAAPDTYKNYMKHVPALKTEMTAAGFSTLATRVPTASS